MKLDENYRLIADDFNFILQRKLKPKKERSGKAREWHNVGYWQDISQALKTYARLRRRSVVSQLQMDELIEAEHALNRQIDAIGKHLKTLWSKTG